MTLWQGIALGALQGATEFLPISSSGHLVVARALLGVRAPGAALEAWLHLGTLAAVLVAFRHPLARLAAFGTGAGRGPGARAALGQLALATLPAAVAGALASARLEGAFASPRAAAAGLLATSCLLASLGFAPAPAGAGRRPQGAPGEPPVAGWGPSVVIGLAQALALLPGLSRSGATIAAGRWLGLDGPTAAAFSFLLSIPVVAAAGALELVRHGAGRALDPAALAGALTAAVVGYACLRALLGMMGRDRLHWFAPYTLALALLVLWRA